MSQTSLSKKFNFKHWLLVNGALVVMVLCATIGESEFVFIMLNALIGFTLFSNVTIFGIICVEHSGQVLKGFVPLTLPYMLLDFFYDAGMLTLLCLLTPWYTWSMYLGCAALSAYFLVSNKTQPKDPSAIKP